jgi:hypothetical protein
LLLLFSPPKDFLRGGGETPPAKKSNAFSDSRPSWERRKGPMRKKGGKGSSPTAHSQFRLLHPLLTSQTTKEVWYQELRVRRRSSTLDCVKYIMNMKYLECYMQRDGPAGRLGLNQCLIDWKNPLPRSRIGYPMCFHHQLKLHALGKIGELSTEL